MTVSKKLRYDVKRLILGRYDIILNITIYLIYKMRYLLIRYINRALYINYIYEGPWEEGARTVRTTPAAAVGPGAVLRGLRGHGLVEGEGRGGLMNVINDYIQYDLYNRNI